MILSPTIPSTHRVKKKPTIRFGMRLTIKFYLNCSSHRNDLKYGSPGFQMKHRLPKPIDR